MQSGRSWESPARRRGSSSQHLYPRNLTDNHGQFKDTTLQQRKIKSAKMGMMTIIILILREDIIWGSIGQNNNGQGGGGRLVTLIAVTHRIHSTKPCASAASPPLPLLLPRASWRTVHGLKEKQMSLCKDEFSLFVL